MPAHIDTHEMVAKTLSGLEPVLADELTALGATDVRAMNRSVAFTGDRRLLYDVNLRCRIATRILVPVSTFRVRTSDDLYRRVGEIDWSQYIDADATLAVDAFLANAPFDNSMFVAQRTKDAVVDQFRRKVHQRPSVDTNRPDLRLNVHIAGSEASLAVDASGDPLSRRGYRTRRGTAPLSEVLAAGIIALTGWNAEAPFVDPMCGSGTFVIEAAMKALRIAPGIVRKYFGFMGWKDFDRPLYDQLVARARSEMLPESPVALVGSDSDRRTLGSARENAARAGVADAVRFACGAVEDQAPPPEPGVMIANPPYGERMTSTDIEALYSTIGDALKQHYDGYDAYIFTGNPQAAKRIGLRTSRRIQLYNGPIECRLLKFEMYRGSRKAG